MTAEEYLKDIRAARKKISALEESRERAFTMATRITTSGDGVRNNGTSRRPEAYGALVDDIDKEIAALQEARREAFSIINQLRDGRFVAVLVGYYIDGLTWEQVAEVNSYSYSHVMRHLRPAALEALEQIRQR